MSRSETRLLRKLREIERTTRISGPVRLSERYLAAIERLKAHPENQSYADKTWVLVRTRAFRRHFQLVRGRTRS